MSIRLFVLNKVVVLVVEVVVVVVVLVVVPVGGRGGGGATGLLLLFNKLLDVETTEFLFVNFGDIMDVCSLACDFSFNFSSTIA